MELESVPKMRYVAGIAAEESGPLVEYIPCEPELLHVALASTGEPIFCELPGYVPKLKSLKIWVIIVEYALV